MSVFLEGGADSLSVLSPQGDPLYRSSGRSSRFGRRRARRGRPPALAPGGGGIAQLYGEKKVSVLPAVGYTNADQSHFTSRHYWEVGATSTSLTTGWLGRYLDRVGTMDNPLQGLSLDNTLAPALATAKVPIASIDGPDQYDFWSNRVWGEVETRMLSAIGGLGATGRRPGACRRRRASRRRSTGCETSSSRSRPWATSPASRARCHTRLRRTRSRAGSPGSRR